MQVLCGLWWVFALIFGGLVLLVIIFCCGVVFGSECLGLAVFAWLAVGFI